MSRAAEAVSDPPSVSPPPKANLGCGQDYREGWLNVDYSDESAADEVLDLNVHPWPWADDSFEHVLMDNVIEHLDDRLATLQELHRVVEPGGTVLLRFPHWNSAGHHTCPSHTKTLTHRTFHNREVNHLFDVREIDCRRVRAGKLLPKGAALWMADHIGQLVSEVEAELEVLE